MSNTNNKNNQSEQELQDRLERLLCEYHSVKTFEALGVGRFKQLLDQLDKQNENNSRESGIVYQNSVLDHACVYTAAKRGEEEESFEKSDIIRRFSECPLLENVYEYMNWSAYSPKYGDLKQFVESLNEENANQNLNIDLLEVEPFSNRLLKLTRNTSIELLKQSIEHGDSLNAAGHLVSLIALKYRSLAQIPRSLLINEMESSLSAFLNKSKNDSNSMAHIFQLRNEYFNYYALQIGQPDACANALFFNFVIELILRIPISIIEQILFSYIIEPLIKLDGDHRLKQKLFEYLTISTWLNNPLFANDAKIGYFVRLGKQCAINEWSASHCTSIIGILATKPKSLATTSLVVLETHQSIESSTEEIKEQQAKELVNSVISSSSDEVKVTEQQSIISLTNQYEDVKSIRERYGIGIELNEQTKSVTESLKGNFGFCFFFFLQEKSNRNKMNLWV